MTTATLPAHGTRGMAPPPTLFPLLTVTWAVATLVTSQLSPEGFTWLSGFGLLGLGLAAFAGGRGNRIDPAEAFYFFVLYYLFGFLLRGVGLLGGMDSPYLRSIGDAHSPYFLTLLGWTFFFAALALLPLYAGYRWRAIDRWVDTRLARRRGLAAPWRTGRTTRVGVTLMALGLAGALLRLRGLGGLAATLDDPVAAGTTEAVGKFWTIALTECAVVGYHVIVLGWCLRGGRGIARKAFAFGLLLAGTLYVATSSKFLILRVLVPPILYLSILRGGLRFSHLVAMFGVFGALFPLFYAYRALGLYRMADVGSYLATTDTPWLKLYNRSYDADSFMIILHRLNEGQGLLWGRSLIELGSFFVPRAWWPDKPASFGLTFPARFMPDTDFGGMTYVTPSLPGELYADFHLPGMLLGFLAIGLCLRGAWRFARAGSPGALLVYGYVFLTAIHLVEGSIASQIETLLMGLVPAWFAHRALRAVPRRAAPRTTRTGAAFA